MLYRRITAPLVLGALLASCVLLAAEFEDPLRGKHVDKEGSQVGGSVSTQSSANISYDPESGEVERNWDEGPDPGKVKKITLKVEVDANDQVREWSVSPKKYTKGGSGS